MSTSTQSVVKTDRRYSQDRGLGERGGRRATDRGGRSAPTACDGCAGIFTLQWVAASLAYDEYRCRECRCQVFAAR